MSDRPQGNPGVIPGTIRIDAGHTSGPRLRFPRNDRPERKYRVWAVRDEGAVIHVAVMHASDSLKTALALGAAESVSADLGSDVTGVVVTSPDGESQMHYPVLATEGV